MPILLVCAHVCLWPGLRGPGSEQVQLSRQVSLSLSMVLNLPNAESLQDSSSHCGDPLNHKSILLLLCNFNYVTVTNH